MTWAPSPDTLARIEEIFETMPAPTHPEGKTRKVRETPLTSEEIQAIREALNDGARGNILAALYDVSNATISNIRNGKR